MQPMPNLHTLPAPAHRWWGLPLLAAMRRDYLGFSQSLKQHGDIVGMRLLGEQAVELFDPELLRQALVEQADSLIRWERGPEVFGQLMGQNVLVTEGPTWQRQRRMLMQAFTPRRVAGYAALMTDAAAAGLDAAVPASAPQAVVAMDTLFSHLTMDVILRTLFGRPAAGDTAAAAQSVQTLSATAFAEMFWPLTLPDWLPLPGKAAKRRALRHMRGLIQQQLDQPPQGGDNLLSMLRGLRDDSSGQALSEQEVFDQCMLSFQAGHETSATALLWWSWLLASHPAAAERARAEVDALLAGRVPGPDDVQQLPWLNATLKEAMRLFPPIAAVLTRRCTTPLRLGPHTLPARTLLRVTPWALHRDGRWFPEPGAFKPERFLPDAPPPPRGAYLPFGLGPRVCLGQHFALLEMGLIAAMLLQRYQFTVPSDMAAPQPVLGVTLRPAQPLNLLLRRRRKAQPQVHAAGGALSSRA
jgi:cytochrome P450